MDKRLYERFGSLLEIADGTKLMGLTDRIGKMIKPLPTPHFRLPTSESGQGVVETLFVTVLFLSGVVFAMVQLNMISMQWLRANEAAFGAARAFVVNDGSYTDLAYDEASYRAAVYTLGPKAVPTKSLVPHWFPGEDTTALGTDIGGEKKKMTSVHIYYIQKIAFASLIQPLAGDNDPFIKTQGMAGSFYGGGFGTLDVSRKKGITGAAHARLVKSPDRKFLNKAYEGAKKFDE